MPLPQFRGFLLSVVLTFTSSPLLGEEWDVTVPMYDKGLATYYVQAQISDLAASEFMVDTGSGYLTINTHTLDALQARKQARYVKELRAILANGAELTIPVYAINELRIGACTIRNVEAAVFPARTRQILGLSALNKAAPFTFSIDPPELVLSNCARPPATSVPPATLVEAAATTDVTGQDPVPVRQ